MSTAFKDLVADVREIVQKGRNVSSGPSASIIIRERDPREIVRNVFYPEKNLVKTVKSGNLLVRSQADYDTFFGDAQNMLLEVRICGFRSRRFAPSNFRHR